MLDLRAAAELARGRIRTRLAAAERQKKGLLKSVAVRQEGASFRAHLFEALRRGGDERQSPSPAPEALFLAFPEKLLGKWSFLAFGEQRQARSDDGPREPAHHAWKVWDALGVETRLKNFARTDPAAVLLAHGLSAIDDSILLLADIGRAWRAGQALRVPLHVLLADVSWISYNRSLKRFDLTDHEIEAGLRLCQDRRQRLYEGVGATVRVHAIVPYQKKGAINSQKLTMIANRYLELAAVLWGDRCVETVAPLGNAELAAIGRPLQVSVAADSPLQSLSRFPGALAALEKALAPHLSVIRTIAQSFRILSIETLCYFFAQYYAQDDYRGTHVKVAPSSTPQNTTLYGAPNAFAAAIVFSRIPADGR